MITSESGKRMLNNLLEIIFRISDKKYQKKVWIRGEGAEIDDFTETVCRFINNGDPVLSEYKKCNLTDDQYQVFKKFRDKFEFFADDHNWPHKFIDTPEWNEITKMAKEVLQAFDYHSPKK